MCVFWLKLLIDRVLCIWDKQKELGRFWYYYAYRMACFSCLYAPLQTCQHNSVLITARHDTHTYRTLENTEDILI
jgi:hypothetical protein